MEPDQDWTPPGRSAGWDVEAAGMGMLRITLLFGSAAIALAMLVVPMLDGRNRQSAVQGAPAGVDAISTSSIGAGKHYTIRRSVLQETPSAVCIIQDNGSLSGDC
jgi:hypothetical protein